MCIHLPHSIKELFDRDFLDPHDFYDLFENLSFFRSLRGYTFLYRGHSNSKFKLLASSARFGFVNDKIELDILKSFKLQFSHLYEEFRLPNFNEDLFYLSIGRHLGLNCRILDWTSGFWEAIAFSLNNMEIDGNLWIMALSQRDIAENISPFNINDDKLHILKENFFIPQHFGVQSLPLGINRRFRQKGFFTTTSSELLEVPVDLLPLESLNKVELFSIPISSEVKNKLVNNRNIPIEDWLYVSFDMRLEKAIKILNEEMLNPK